MLNSFKQHTWDAFNMLATWHMYAMYTMFYRKTDFYKIKKL